jgi:addiction module HigA family antidote
LEDEQQREAHSSTAKPRIAPIHSGVYLKEILDELGLFQYRLAQELGVPAMQISHVARGQRPMTAELALRLGGASTRVRAIGFICKAATISMLPRIWWAVE